MSPATAASLWTLALGERFMPGFFTEPPWRRLLFVVWPIALAPMLFTWLLPTLMRYRRGGMAQVGLAISIAFTVLIPLRQVWPAWNRAYGPIHDALFVVFYIYAAAGLALCAVGIYDHKRSAVWAALAVLGFLVSAILDTVIWFGLMSGPPTVPWGFLAFIVLIAIGFVRRSADLATSPDLREMAESLRNNRTRRSRSLVRKLLREGSIHLLPVYAIFIRSDLGREGIENSGSFEFADHIYRNVPSGRGPLGRWMDRKILAMPATRAFRLRYLKAQEEMHRALRSFPESTEPLRVLAVPCGIPRDFVELVETLRARDPGLLPRIEYWGMDLDPALLERAKEFTRACPVRAMHFVLGNALLKEEFPAGPFHFVVSTGLGEFLHAKEIAIFYRNVQGHLAPGGTFYTSATRYEKRSEAFLSSFELITQYRTTTDLESILRTFPWRQLTLVQDDTGLQTFVVATKGER